jgi:hypothetical protein
MSLKATPVRIEHHTGSNHNPRPKNITLFPQIPYLLKLRGGEIYIFGTSGSRRQVEVFFDPVGNVYAIPMTGNKSTFIGALLKDGRTVEVEGIKLTRDGEKVLAELLEESVSPPSPNPPVIQPPPPPPAVAAKPVPVPPAEVPLGLFGNPTDEKHYVEIRGVEVLKHGDILPGNAFQLGDPRTYGRELLTINTEPPSIIHTVLELAAALTPSPLPIETKALRIASIVKMIYSPNQDKEVHAGEARTLGKFMEEGGCCRHRAATLQLALQAADIRSRYVRGGVVGVDSLHAWVEVDVDENDSFAYVIDPNSKSSNNSGRVVSSTSLPKFYQINGKDIVYIPQEQGATVWRHRSQVDS